MRPSRFETLRVWHQARRFTTRIYAICTEGRLSRDFGLRDQMCRAAISIMSNIAEGYERGGAKELVQFLRIARGSAAEIRAQLYAAEDIGYLDAETARKARAEVLSITRQLSVLSTEILSRNTPT